MKDSGLGNSFAYDRFSGGQRPIQNIGRDSVEFEVNLVSGQYLSEPFDFSMFSGGFVALTTDWTAASVGFFAGHASDGAFYPVKDDADAYAQMTLTSGSTWYKLDEDVFAGRWLKFWSKAAGTSGANVIQADNRVFRVMLKG